MSKRDEILLVTLQLAAEKGLGNVSLSQIAKRVGLQKTSLYSHFSSKDDIISSLYDFLRERAKEANEIGPIDYGRLVRGRSAVDILQGAVEKYRQITRDSDMRMFYRFIMSERMFNKEAARIMVKETERMILATKQLFYAMQVHKVMSFANVDQAALAFAMTIHALLDYENDKQFADQVDVGQQIADYIHYFCELHQGGEIGREQ